MCVMAYKVFFTTLYGEKHSISYQAAHLKFKFFIERYAISINLNYNLFLLRFLKSRVAVRNVILT